jgi:PAS domain S-box-containing protein
VFPLTLGTRLEQEFRLAATGEIRSFEYFDGLSGQWFLIRCFPRKEGGITVYFQDITSHKLTDEALLRERNVLQSIMNGAKNSHLVYLDREFNFVRVNDTYAATCGYRPEEMIGRNHFSLYPHAENEAIFARVRDTGEPFEVHDKPFEFPDHPERGVTYWDWMLSPVKNRAGDVTGIVFSLYDTTRRKKAEEALQTMNDELERRVEQRTRELQETQSQYLHAEKLSAIGQLSASIAHELNNPLQGVLTILKGLKRRAILDEEDKELLDLAIDENERMKILIRSLRDFNQPSPGRKTVMDVHASLDSLLMLYRNDFRRKGISTVLNYAEGLPRILAIPDQIKQVFLNLLNNATDACLPNGGQITITTCHVQQRVAVTITDTGIGISPENLDRIFHPFFTTKSTVKGTGLGLSVCHGIVQNHNGEIRVESRPGDGSTFTVLLPVNGK